MRAVALSLVLVAACAGGNDSGVTKSAFVDKAEAVCAKANHEFGALTTPSDTAGVLTYVQNLVQIAERATLDLGKVEVPSADRAQVEQKMLVPLREQVSEGRDYVAEVRTALQKGDQAALAKLVSDPPTPAEADLAWMRSYGFEECVTMADTGDR
jgi:hypothetical protein